MNSKGASSDTDGAFLGSKLFGNDICIDSDFKGQLGLKKDMKLGFLENLDFFKFDKLLNRRGIFCLHK